MTAATATMDDKALLAAPEAPPPPPASMIVEVARRHGISPLRQGREMVALRFGPGRIRLPEYYSSGLFDPAIPMEEKKQYVGISGSWLLNEALSPSTLTGLQTFVSNKVLFTSLIDQLGFGTTETQAVVSNIRRYGNIPALATPEDLRAFLTGPARFPLFGKPQAYSGSFGSALIDGVDGDNLVLGNGKRIALDAFCREIISEYGDGYLLQSALQQHPAMEQMTGKAVGSIRLVTVRTGVMPDVFYALWKIPSPKAMSDNFWQSGSMIAQIDSATGKVGRCRIGTGLEARDIEEHPVSGQRFDSLTIPHWDEACRMAREAHAVLSEFGVIGWDVAITEDGPVLIECNDNPFHSLYQIAFCRGIRNDDFRPILDAVTARSKELLAAKEERIAKRSKPDRKPKT